MAFTVAVAGKGGAGKTTLAALLVQSLIERGEGPVLAVDADPNFNLAQSLGYRVVKTISELRDELLEHIRQLPPGITKDDYLELGIQECLEEGRGVDLLVMGAGEGPRCYCAVNQVLRRCIDRLRGAYRYVVMDNEAGLEHLSRCTTQDVDVLLIVSNMRAASIQAAFRIHELSKRLALRIGKQFLVLSDFDDDAVVRIKAEAQGMGLQLVGSVPSDPRLRQLSRDGDPLTQLPTDSEARIAVRKILDAVLSKPVLTVRTG